MLATEENVAEQNKLKLEVNRIKDQGKGRERLYMRYVICSKLNVTRVAFLSLVNSKVAFSATIIESNGVFTGPASNSNLLIFDRVFTNIGNAYNSETGVFYILKFQRDER